MAKQKNTVEGLVEEVSTKKQELLELNLKKKRSELKNVKLIAKVKRDIARLMTSIAIQEGETRNG